MTLTIIVLNISNIAMPSEVAIEIAVVGDSGVGKTSLLTKLCFDTFKMQNPTICMELFNYSTVTKTGDTVEFLLYDTAGQERFQSLVSNYYRNAHGGIVMFDLQSRASFEQAKYWLEELRKHANNLHVTALVGNKLDSAVAFGREVSKAEAERFAIIHNLAYFETSARTGNNLKALLDHMAETIPRRFEERARVRETLRLSEAAWSKEEQRRIQEASRKIRCCRR